MNTDAALRAQTDPFTLANRAIFDALVGWAPLAAVVRAGNRTSTVPRDDAIPADRAANVAKVPTNFPGFLISQGGYLLMPTGRNSRTVDVRQEYIVQWATDVLTVVGLNVVKWETTRAFINAGDTLGLDFVRNYTVRDAQEGVAIVVEQPTAASGGTPGWVTSFVVSVEMFFDRRTVLNITP